MLPHTHSAKMNKGHDYQHTFPTSYLLHPKSSESSSTDKKYFETCSLPRKRDQIHEIIALGEPIGHRNEINELKARLSVFDEYSFFLGNIHVHNVDKTNYTMEDDGKKESCKDTSPSEIRQMNTIQSQKRRKIAVTPEEMSEIDKIQFIRARSNEDPKQFLNSRLETSKALAVFDDFLLMIPETKDIHLHNMDILTNEFIIDKGIFSKISNGFGYDFQEERESDSIDYSLSDSEEESVDVMM